MRANHLRTLLAPILELADKAGLQYDLPLYITVDVKDDFTVRAWNRYSRGAFRVTHPDQLKRAAYGEVIVAIVNAFPALLALADKVEALLAEVHRLRAELADLTELADAQCRIASERERPYVEQWQRETGKANTLPDYGDLLHWVIGKNEVLRGALTAYPFGGLAGLLTELETSIGHRFECARPEDCGPLGCLIAKVYHTKKAVEEALR